MIPMTTRERFLRVFHWQAPDRLPNLEFGYWDETIEAWHRQGLPLNIHDNEAVERYLGLEGVSIFTKVPIKNGLFPPFEKKVIKDLGDRLLMQDEDGNLCEVPPGRGTMPKFLKYLIASRQDWERVKREYLDYKNPGRIGDVKKAVDEARASGTLVIFDPGSLYGWPRNWMGLENFSIAVMEDRPWVEEMMEHLTEMTLYLIEKGFPENGIDVGWWWEDMCYNHGPLLSPKLFQEMMVPRYKRVTAALKKLGIDLNVLDCDGRIYELVPGWLEAGINVMFPIEALHTDPFELREIYGDRVLLLGGVNKLSLIRGREAIDRELEGLVPLIAKGGFIPTVDHRVPPDVTFENYLYYLERKKSIL